MLCGSLCFSLSLQINVHAECWLSHMNYSNVGSSHSRFPVASPVKLLLSLRPTSMTGTAPDAVFTCEDSCSSPSFLSESLAPPDRLTWSHLICDLYADTPTKEDVHPSMPHSIVNPSSRLCTFSTCVSTPHNLGEKNGCLGQ